MKKIWLASLFLVSIVNANERHYKVDIEKSIWKVDSAKLACKLEHEIPEYGKLTFSQNSGFPEQLKLEVYYGRGLIRERGDVVFSPAPWKPREEAKEGFKFKFADAGEPIEFSSRQTRQILDALDQGYQPTFVHRDKTDLTNLIKAEASSVNFNKSYQKYIECQANLLPYSFDQIRNSSVYFDTGSVRLDDEAQKWLEYVLEYARDPALRRIELSGYTDSVGSFRANHKLASYRVEEVQKYLLNAGIPEKQIVMRVYGEQRPEGDNRTSEGRRSNRRVAIRVLR